MGGCTPEYTAGARGRVHPLSTLRAHHSARGAEVRLLDVTALLDLAVDAQLEGDVGQVEAAVARREGREQRGACRGRG